MIYFLLGNTGFYTLGAFILAKNTQGMRSETFIYWFLTLGYFLYGQFLKKFPDQKTTSIKTYLSFILPVLLNIIGSYYLKGNFFGNYLQSYLGFTIIISSISLFKILLTINTNQIWQKYSLIVKELARDSFSVYLMHVIMLEFFLFRTPLTIDHGPFNPAVMIGLIWLALVIGSFCTSFLIRRLPYLKWIVGEK